MERRKSVPPETPRRRPVTEEYYRRDKEDSTLPYNGRQEEKKSAAAKCQKKLGGSRSFPLAHKERLLSPEESRGLTAGRRQPSTDRDESCSANRRLPYRGYPILSARRGRRKWQSRRFSPDRAAFSVKAIRPAVALSKTWRAGRVNAPVGEPYRGVHTPRSPPRTGFRHRIRRSFHSSSDPSRSFRRIFIHISAMITPGMVRLSRRTRWTSGRSPVDSRARRASSF